MPDKQRFVGELARVCAPGGHIIVVTWCHRVLQVCGGRQCSGSSWACAPPGATASCASRALHAAPSEPPFCGAHLCLPVSTNTLAAQPGEQALTADEQSLLDRICEAYYLPAWCSAADYQRIMQEQGLEGALLVRRCLLVHCVTACRPQCLAHAARQPARVIVLCLACAPLARRSAQTSAWLTGARKSRRSGGRSSALR